MMRVSASMKAPQAIPMAPPVLNPVGSESRLLSGGKEMKILVGSADFVLLIDDSTVNLRAYCFVKLWCLFSLMQSLSLYLLEPGTPLDTCMIQHLHHSHDISGEDILSNYLCLSNYTTVF